MRILLLTVIAVIGMTCALQAQDLEIICPDDVTVECSDEVILSDPIVTGGLEPYEIELVVTEDDDDDCAIVQEYIWTVTDDNGYEAVCITTVTLVDTQAPVVTYCPYDMEIDCSDDIPFSIQAQFSDNCQSVTVSYTDNVVSQDGCSFVLERTYSGQDDCGNTSYCVQTITAIDLGCSDPLGCNYDSNSQGTNCQYPGSNCDDSNSNTTEDQFDENCECVGLLLGCTNPDACDFNPLAEADDGSCHFAEQLCDDLDPNTGNDHIDENCNCIGEILGCTDSQACNFSSEAVLDDNSCLFPYDSCVMEDFSVLDSECVCQQGLFGVVFIDDNWDGQYNSGETGLPYQTVTIEELNVQLITDDNGEFSFWPIPEGIYTVTVSYTSEWSNYTSDVSQTVAIPFSNDSNIMFGASEEATPDPAQCIDFYQSGAGVPCNDFLNYNICYRNMSPYAVSGVIEVQLNDLLSFEGSYPVADSIVGQSVFWSFEDQQSWVLNMDDIQVATPSEEYIGEYMSTTAIVYVWFEGELLEVTSNTIVQEVTCAYDPNDITVIPEGYTDDHLVLPETTLEYVIRFQNTGNAPATNVMVVDTLDPGMDFDTFQFVANSHSVLTTIEPSGRIEFFFENIMLPDSTEDEPGSHGLVSFKIDMIENIEIGQEINSTAYIFFDNNPPVITNTTWTTVHACGDEAMFSASQVEVCEGTEVDFMSEYPNIEEYTWEIDGEPAGDQGDFGFLFDTAGDFEVHFIAVNPLCADSTSMNIYVEATPIAEITVDGSVFTASEGDSYQWYADGEPIMGETNQTFSPNLTPADDGAFYVIVYSELGCSAQSETLTILGVDAALQQDVSVYPNPMTGSTWVSFADNKQKTISLINAQGKIVDSWLNITDLKIEIEKGDLSIGAYIIHIQQDGKVATVKLLVE